MDAKEVMVFITANRNYTLSSSTHFSGYARKITASVATSYFTLFALLSIPPRVISFSQYNLQSVMVITDF